MRLSVIVNTCSLALHAGRVTGSTTPTPHSFRAYALRHFILPHYVAYADEVIVVGEYEPGPGYTYIESPSVFRSAVDALAQRQKAFEASTSEYVLCAHDDHFVDVSRFERLRWWEADVFVPERWRRGEGRQNNGMADGYVGGHAAIYARATLERVPWGEVPKVHVWDTEHTRMLLEAGMRIKETGDVIAWDVEVET